jgi:hypothetical protein
LLKSLFWAGLRRDEITNGESLEVQPRVDSELFGTCIL